jgi:hypothetical protein
MNIAQRICSRQAEKTNKMIAVLSATPLLRIVIAVGLCPDFAVRNLGAIPC